MALLGFLGASKKDTDIKFNDPAVAEYAKSLKELNVWLEEVVQGGTRVENALRFFLPSKTMQNRTAVFETAAAAIGVQSSLGAGILSGGLVERITFGTTTRDSNAGNPARDKYIGHDYVVVTRKEGASWEAVLKSTGVQIMNYMLAYNSFSAKGRTPLGVVNIGMLTPEKSQQQLIDQNRASGDTPYIAALRSMFQLASNAIAYDGGSVDLQKFEDGVAYYSTKGACRPCSMKPATIERLVWQRIKILQEQGIFKEVKKLQPMS